MRSAPSIRRIGNARRSSSTSVGFKEDVPLVTFFLAAIGAFLTPSYFLYGKIDSSIKEIKEHTDSSLKLIRDDNATSRDEMRTDIATLRTDNASFRSEIITLHSDISKNLMVHNGEITTLKERSNMKPPI